MLIGIDASRANKPQKTGTEWYSFYLIQALKELTTDCQFVLYSKEPLRGELADLPANFTSRVLGWPPQKLWTQLRLSWEMLTHPPDVLFVPAHIIPLIHPRLTCTTLHDIGFARYPELYSPTELKYHNWAAMFALKHARQIITISNFSKQEIGEIYHYPAEKIAVTYLGYDPNQYHLINNQEIIKRVLTKHQIEQPYFFYIGRLEKKKNIIGLITAFKQFLSAQADDKNYQLVLAGQPGFDFVQIQNKIIQYNLVDKVIKLGWIDEADVSYLMVGAQALVMPSFYEGFCLPVLQAMACGTSVIASNSAAIPEIAAGATLLVNPWQINEISRAMSEIVRNDELRAELRHKGLKRCQDFSWEKCARETLSVLVALAP